MTNMLHLILRLKRIEENNDSTDFYTLYFFSSKAPVENDIHKLHWQLFLPCRARSSATAYFAFMSESKEKKKRTFSLEPRFSRYSIFFSTFVTLTSHSHGGETAFLMQKNQIMPYKDVFNSGEIY